MNSNTEFNSKEIKGQFKFEKAIDKQFYERVYSKSLTIYEKRLSQISMKAKNLVLDAGCGFGQWTIALSHLNGFVVGIDADIKKVKIAKLKAQMENAKNISFEIGSIEQLPFNDESFDAIICYSVIYRTNFKKSLKEFYRILKPHGMVYIVTNAIGWYIFNLVTGHSSARDFNARIHSVQSIYQSIKYKFRKKIGKSKGDLFLSPTFISREMTSIGFKKILIQPEGHISLEGKQKLPFYPKKFLGLTNVFELLAEK